MKIAVWQGFDHYWDMDPHRLNLFSSYIEPGGDDEEAGDVVFRNAMAIGRFPPDVCHTYSAVVRLGTPTTGFIDGESTVRLAGSVGERVGAEGERVSLPLPGPDLRATVIMRGFTIQSSNFKHGFHTRGFGFLLDDVEQHHTHGEDHLAFVPKFFIFPDRSPDPTTNPNRLMWRVLPFPDSVEPKTPREFEYRMTLHYRVLYDETDRVVFVPHVVNRAATSADYPVRYPGPDSYVEVSGRPGGEYTRAAVGFRGFGWELRDWPGTRYQGRYLRKLKFIIEGMTYEALSGCISYDSEMLFTNYGIRDGKRDVEEQRRRWLAFLRNRDWPFSDRVRAFARLVLGSSGFDARYTFYGTMIQFKGAQYDPPERVYQVMRSSGQGINPVRSLLKAVQRRTSNRGAAEPDSRADDTMPQQDGL